MWGQRNRILSKSGAYILGGVILSFLLHIACFVLFSWSTLTKDTLFLSEKGHNLQINLESSELNYRKSEEVNYSANKQIVKYPYLFPGSSSLDGPIYSFSHDDSKTSTVMQLIQRQVAPIWQMSTPPEVGKIILRMELDTKGRIASLWILQAQGSQLLVEHIKNLLRQAAPFCKAMEGFSRPLILDCLFHITPKTAQSISEG